MALDDHIILKKVLTNKNWEVIELVHKVLKLFKSAMIFLEGDNCVTVSFIPTLIKVICTKLRYTSNSTVEPGPSTSVKNLVKISTKYFR